MKEPKGPGHKTPHLHLSHSTCLCPAQTAPRASVRRSGAATATGPSPRATQQHGQNQQKMRQRTKPDPQRHGSTPPVKQYTRPASRRPRSTAHSDPLAEQRQSWLVCVLSTCAVLGCWLALRYSSPPPLLPPLLGHFFVDTPTW